MTRNLHWKWLRTNKVENQGWLLFSSPVCLFSSYLLSQGWQAWCMVFACWQWSTSGAPLNIFLSTIVYVYTGYYLLHWSEWSLHIWPSPMAVVSPIPMNLARTRFSFLTSSRIGRICREGKWSQTRWSSPRMLLLLRIWSPIPPNPPTTLLAPQCNLQSIFFLTHLVIISRRAGSGCQVSSNSKHKNKKLKPFPARGVLVSQQLAVNSCMFSVWFKPFLCFLCCTAFNF